MVFIVSDQRIATENFEKGKIYKVVFLDESIFYGVCIGIGSNFVMLSGNISGYLFPLTMETASQVESIDLYTPEEPEPPVPPMTNLLQYQTGLPPFNFNTTVVNLFSWYIKGNMQHKTGDRTENMFDESILQIGYYGTASGFPYTADDKYRCFSMTLSAGTYTIFAKSSSLIIRLLRVSSLSLGANAVNKDNQAYTFTLSAEDTIYVSLRNSTTTNDFTGLTIMLNAGSTALPYEPYGFKIPISCNENLTNIYLDAPLEEGEFLYSTDLDTAIITAIGDNTLSVLTEAQPSEMQIVYKIADR